MDDSTQAFRQAIGDLAEQWLTMGLPSRQGLDEAADELLRLRQRLKVVGIWQDPPLMVTASLDDAVGQGLTIIQTYAAAMGIRLIPLGLMKTPEVIIDACHHHQPDFLGLTVLQFDTEEALIVIANQLPCKTQVMAGGPVFVADPDFARRTGIHYTAENVAAFMRMMLDQTG